MEVTCSGGSQVEAKVTASHLPGHRLSELSWATVQVWGCGRGGGLGFLHQQGMAAWQGSSPASLQGSPGGGTVQEGRHEPVAHVSHA